jgi:hypothetical protein
MARDITKAIPYTQNIINPYFFVLYEKGIISYDDRNIGILSFSRNELDRVKVRLNIEEYISKLIEGFTNHVGLDDNIDVISAIIYYIAYCKTWIEMTSLRCSDQNKITLHNFEFLDIHLCEWIQYLFERVIHTHNIPNIERLYDILEEYITRPIIKYDNIF